MAVNHQSACPDRIELDGASDSMLNSANDESSPKSSSWGRSASQGCRTKERLDRSFERRETGDNRLSPEAMFV